MLVHSSLLYPPPKPFISLAAVLYLKKHCLCILRLLVFHPSCASIGNLSIDQVMGTAVLNCNTPFRKNLQGKAFDAFAATETQAKNINSRVIPGRGYIIHKRCRVQGHCCLG